MEIKTKVGMVEITQKIKDDERLWWLQAAIEKADPAKTRHGVFRCMGMPTMRSNAR